MAPHSSTLAWKIPRTEKPGRLQSMRSLRVGHDWVTSLSLSNYSGAFLVAQMVKISLQCRRSRFDPWSGRSPGEGNGNPHQCSCLGNPDGLKEIHLQTLWTGAHQALLSMGVSRQEYWSGLPCLPPGDLPNWRIESMSLTSPTLAGGFFNTSATWEAPEVGALIT